MKIAVLNEFFLNEKHLARLKALGEVEVFGDTTTQEQAIERLKGVDIALGDCFIAPFNKDILGSTDNLKLLVLNSTGFDLVDLEAANAKGIKVANAPGFSTDAVAELAIGLMFAVNRKIVLGDKAMRSEPFEADPSNREHDKFWGFDLKRKTLGIIGLGKIGTRAAEIGQGLGMKVIAFNRTPKQIEGVELVTLEEVLKRSDVVSVHLALNSETENLISKRELGLMKPTAIIINTGGSRLVITKDLLEVLQTREIAGAGIDTLGITKDNPILKLENIVLTPHIGSSTEESWKINLPEIAVSNVESFAKGTPQNLVN